MRLHFCQMDQDSNTFISFILNCQSIYIHLYLNQLCMCCLSWANQGAHLEIWKDNPQMWSKGAKDCWGLGCPPIAWTLIFSLEWLSGLGQLYPVLSTSSETPFESDSSWLILSLITGICRFSQVEWFGTTFCCSVRLLRRAVSDTALKPDLSPTAFLNRWLVHSPVSFYSEMIFDFKENWCGRKYKYLQWQIFLKNVDICSDRYLKI